MGVSILILKLVVMLVVHTLGMVGISVSSLSPTMVTLTVLGDTFLVFLLLLAKNADIYSGDAVMAMSSGISFYFLYWRIRTVVLQ